MNFLVIDSLGWYVEQSNGLANKGKNKVRYWTSWQGSQTFEYYASGKGFEYLEKVLYMADHYEWADCIVNFGVTHNDTIAFLRKVYPNKSIFGCGQGEKLENDRWWFKKIIRDVGLPLHKAEKIKGVVKLREYLKHNKDKYIKINIFRGNIESFYARDFDSVELILNELESALGPFKDGEGCFEFIVEDAIKTDIESGFDVFFNGNDFIKPYLVSYEWRKSLYVAHVTDTLPIPLEETMRAFRPVLKRLDYRGGFSTEEKIFNKKEHYFIDLCARLAFPLTVFYPEYILNWADVVYKIGKKENVRLDIRHKYLAALPLETKHLKDNWVKVDLDEKDRDHIKMVDVTQHEGKYYLVKGSDGACVIVAGGNTVDEVLNIIKKYAHKVDALNLNKEISYGVDHIKDIIKEGQKVGIDF